MKIVHLGVLAMAFWLLPANTSFARPKNVYKTVAAQKSGKPGGNSREAKKKGPSINGTEIRRKR